MRAFRDSRQQNKFVELIREKSNDHPGGTSRATLCHIDQRCDEGIKRAKAKGTVFGRKSVLDAGQRRKIAERYAAGETMRELAIDYEVGEATIWRALRG